MFQSHHVCIKNLDLFHDCVGSNQKTRQGIHRRLPDNLSNCQLVTKILSLAVS